MEPISKAELIAFIKEHGAYDVRVADPRKGFEHALPGRHPLTILPSCRSVVVFAMPCPVWVNNTVLGLYVQGGSTIKRSELGPQRDAAYSPQHNLRLMKGVIYGHTWYASAYYLNQRGYKVADFMNRAARPQDKLCAYEAGLGIYGRSGLLLHPQLGNRFAPGVLLTDALIEPDGRLEGFAPCRTCGACVKACPGQAFDSQKQYPDSWEKTKCHGARGKLAKEKIYCHECMRVCPAANIGDEELAFMRRIFSVGEKVRRDRQSGDGPSLPVVQDITPV